MVKSKVTVSSLKEKKLTGNKISVLTAYDYSMAKLLDEAGVDVLLVGDSLGMVILGYDSTLPVTMADMIHHTKAVARGTQKAMVVADMPFMSYQVSKEESLRNAGRLLQEAGAQAVKLEGGREVAETVGAMVKAGIPVMGHLGLTPQSVHQLGGYQVQGKSLEAARRLMEDAQILEEAGVFALVLECIPAALARAVTKKISVPTIGIGAGPECDGQVLVSQDLLGLYSNLTPKFVKKYADLKEPIIEAVRNYIKEVEAGTFPAQEHCFTIAPVEISKLY